MTDEKTVEDIINCCKTYNLYYVKRKDITRNFLYKYGLLQDDADNEIRTLSKINLFEGPVPDKDVIGEYVWIFKKLAFGKWCYIKLKIKENRRLVIIISFHEDDNVRYKI